MLALINEPDGSDRNGLLTPPRNVAINIAKAQSIKILK